METLLKAPGSRLQDVDGSFNLVIWLGSGESSNKLKLQRVWLEALSMTLCRHTPKCFSAVKPFHLFVIYLIQDCRICTFLPFFPSYFLFMRFLSLEWLFNYCSLALYGLVFFFCFLSKYFFDSFISCTTGCVVSRLIGE